MGELLSMAALLTKIFGRSSSHLARSIYGFRLVGTILCTLSQAGRNAGCLLAFSPQAAGGRGEGDELAGMVGVVTVHMIELQNDAGRMATALQLPRGTAMALIANLAVEPEARRQGIGKRLVGAVESLVKGRFRPQPAALMLLVDRDNVPAMTLYQSLGFVECAEWVDPAWLEDAHKGRLGSSKRLLFVKKLRQQGAT